MSQCPHQLHFTDDKTLMKGRGRSSGPQESDRIRFEKELEEGLDPLKRETEAPQGLGISAWVGMNAQESKEH